MSLPSEVRCEEKEPTAFLQVLDDVCMSLPIDDSMHEMQLRTPVRAPPPPPVAVRAFESPMSSDAGSGDDFEAFCVASLDACFVVDFCAPALSETHILKKRSGYALKGARAKIQI